MAKRAAVIRSKPKSHKMILCFKLIKHCQPKNEPSFRNGRPMPNKLTPINSRFRPNQLFINRDDIINIGVDPLTHLIFNPAQFTNDPTSSGRWVKNHPTTSLNVNTMNPTDPKRFMHANQVSKIFTNCNPILEFKVPNSQTTLLFRPTKRIPIHFTRFRFQTIIVPQKSSTYRIHIFNHFFWQNKYLTPVGSDAHQN